MTLTDALGLLAASLTTASLVPQVTKIWKTRSAVDVSLKMFSLFTLGVGLWLIYGLLKTELPIILANAVSLLLATAILCMKLWFDRKARPARESSLSR